MHIYRYISYKLSSIIFCDKLAMARSLRLIVVMTCLSLTCFLSESAELPRVLVEHSVKCDGLLSFLVVGDWGRGGDFNQSQVAHQMGIVGEALDIDFIVSTGDNFYDDGLKSINDPKFEDSFTKIYTAKSLQKQWFSVLGNHDYRGNVLAQLSPFFRIIDSRWLCLRSFVVNTEIVDLFFVDTTPLSDKYFLRPKNHRYDWRGVLPRTRYISNLLKDLDSALKNSVATWKFVVGHHTIKSAGHHGDTMELVENVLPILEENNVDLYLNGHDHCLQHISSDRSQLQFLTSGGGSKAWKGDFSAKTNQKEVKFYYDGQGFISVQLTQTNVVVSFHDIYGKVLHNLNLSKGISSAA